MFRPRYGRKANSSFPTWPTRILLNIPLNCSLVCKMALTVKDIRHLRSHSTPHDRRENKGSEKGVVCPVTQEMPGKDRSRLSLLNTVIQTSNNVLEC